MTKIEIVDVTCPVCGSEGQYRHYASANVTLEPDLKLKILDNSLFTFHCGNCGASVLVETDCLYHDMTERLFYQLTPDAESDEQLREIFQKMSSVGVMLSFEEEGYQVRLVSSLNDLKEKILISDAGLDDRVIELLKIYIEAMASDQFDDDECIKVVFLSREEDALSFGVLGEEGFLGGAEIPMETYEEEAEMLDLNTEEETYLINREWALEMMRRREA